MASFTGRAVPGRAVPGRAGPAAQDRPRRAGYTALLAVLALVIAWSYGAGGGDATSDLLFAGGLILLPAWMIWTSRLAPAVRPA